MASITRYTPSAPSEALHAIWEGGVAALHKPYSLPSAKFHSLINADRAVVHVAAVDGTPVGFALTYLIPVGSKSNPAKQHYRGSLAALVVLPSHAKQGLGTQLNDAAVAQLSADIKASYTLSTPPASAGEIQLGSTFPRIFPGLPALPAFEGAKAWLSKRGWTIKDSKNIDLYGKLPNNTDLEKQTQTAKEHGIVFRPATAADEAALMELEYGEFDSFTVSVSPGSADDPGLAGPVPALHRGRTRRGHLPRDQQARRGDRRDVGSDARLASARAARLARPAGRAVLRHRMRRRVRQVARRGRRCGHVRCRAHRPGPPRRGRVLH